MFLRSRARPAHKLTTSLPSVSRLSRQSGILNISQSYRFAWSVTEIGLLFILQLNNYDLYVTLYDYSSEI
jgi:hypothetical protein